MDDVAGGEGVILFYLHPVFRKLPKSVILWLKSYAVDKG